MKYYIETKPNSTICELHEDSNVLFSIDVADNASCVIELLEQAHSVIHKNNLEYIMFDNVKMESALFCAMSLYRILAGDKEFAKDCILPFLKKERKDLLDRIRTKKKQEKELEDSILDAEIIG